MADPLGLIGGSTPAHPIQTQKTKLPAGGQSIDPNAPTFKDLLMENLAKVNTLQQDATQAVEDLHAGERDDLEQVLMATQKADTAFRMLLQVRNKLMDAYQEVQQIRV
ncbi:MAG: flagellar hook-basal body complex protein FliE [Planctomycetota bacterium]